MTTVYKLTEAEIKRLLPYGCKDINCCTCPFGSDENICNELLYLFGLWNDNNIIESMRIESKVIL